MFRLPVIITLVSLVCAGLIGWGVYMAVHTSSAPADPSTLSLNTAPPPWPPETAHLRARLASINLPALGAEGTVLHIHQHLDIFVNGTPVGVPALIGIDPAGTFIAPLHTHQTDNVIHVESEKVATFTLGQFFDVWGLRLSDSCLGSLCAQGTQKLQVYNNGKLWNGKPRDLTLTAHAEIVVTYGTDDKLPNPIPSSFNFPAGE